MRSKYQLFGFAAISALVMVLLGVLVLGGLFFAVGGFSLNAPVAEASSLTTTAAQAETAAERTITVVGEGRVRAQPDTAQANIGVEVVNRNIAEATSEASTIMDRLLTVLQEQGVAPEDIQTSYYNVWVERPFSPEGGQSTEPIYHVNNNVSVTIRELDNVATILGAAIEAGANSINGVTFSITDPSELRTEARQEAIDDARATAEELAAMSGVEIGRVVGISEVISSGAYYVSEQAVAMDGRGGGGGPISPGEVEITAQLQVSYAIE